MPKHSLAMLDPACPCCRLTIGVLDVVKDAEFQDAMAAMTAAMARLLHPDVAKAGRGAADVATYALFLIQKQVLQTLSELSDQPASN